MVWQESNFNRVIDRQIQCETRDSLSGEPGMRARRALTFAMRAAIAVNLLVVFATAAGIVNVLKKEQVLDLLAYLLSGPLPKTPVP
jgi:hypothetical protein